MEPSIFEFGVCFGFRASDFVFPRCAHRARILWVKTLLLQFIALLLGCPASHAADAVEAAHRELWRRFVSPHGTLYDYTALDGQVELPTAA